MPVLKGIQGAISYCPNCSSVNIYSQENESTCYDCGERTVCIATSLDNVEGTEICWLNYNGQRIGTVALDYLPRNLIQLFNTLRTSNITRKCDIVLFKDRANADLFAKSLVKRQDLFSNTEARESSRYTIVATPRNDSLILLSILNLNETAPILPFLARLAEVRIVIVQKLSKREVQERLVKTLFTIVGNHNKKFGSCHVFKTDSATEYMNDLRWNFINSFSAL